MRILSSLFLTVLLLFICIPSFGASKFSYDSFYEAEADFRDLDKELNAGFKKLMDELSPRERQILLDEQRKWHGKLFSELVQDRVPPEKPNNAAKEILQARVDDFAKLLTAKNADNILGFPLTFGLSKQAVAQKLGLSSLASLNAKPSNDLPALRIKMFGEEVPVYFNFAATRFVPFIENEAAAFKKFLIDVLKAPASVNPQTGYEISNLYGIRTGDLESREDFSILNEGLSKKYKRVYPLQQPLASFFADNGYPGELTEAEIARASTEFIYEDRQRYIMLQGSWGTLTGQFGIDYFSKKYAQLHIPTVQGLIGALAQIQTYQDSLVLLPELASISDVIYAIGDRELQYLNGDGYGYSLSGSYKEGDRDCTVMVYLNPENRAYAVCIQYIEEEFTKFEEGLLARLAKKYKKLADTPMDVMYFAASGTNFDIDFESQDNYIHFGTTPHYAVQRSLYIINKKELPKYIAVWKSKQEAASEENEKHREDVREESSKF